MKSVIEYHHAMGWEIDETAVVTLCLNCHMLATFAQHDIGLFASSTTTAPLELLPMALRALATFFELLIGSLLWMADVIEAHIKGLDKNAPTWRTLPGLA